MVALLSTDSKRDQLVDMKDTEHGPQLNHARTLPGWRYTSADQFQQERATVLDTSWHCLGRADEIPNVGDFLTAHLLDEPLIAVRGADGVRVLSNICRHRAMPLVQGSGSTKRFLCPYHAWSYRLDGSLIRAPHMENATFDPKTCRLPEFPCVEWNGFLYVNLSGDAGPLAPQLTELDALIRAYQPETYEIVHSEEEVWHCNWKCLVENFMEGYHLSVVHPKTLRGYTPTELARKSTAGSAFTSYIAHYPEDIPPRGTGAPGLSAEQRHASTLFSVFPTQVASISANLLVSLSLRPMDTDRVDVRWTMSIYPGDRDDALIRQRIDLWREVNREDREKLELLQKGLRSRHASDGPLAGPDLEGTIHDFHRFLDRHGSGH